MENHKLVMTLLVRDEMEFIHENIQFHLNQGVDFIIVTDNGSTDGTREVLEEYQKAGVLEVIDEPEQTYEQKKWVTRMAHLALEKYGAKWVLNNDADEFWFSKSGNLKNELKSTGFNVLACPRINMLPDEEILNGNYRFYHNPAAVIRPLKNEASREKPEKISYLTKISQKVIAQTNGLEMVYQGNHDVIIENKVVKNSEDILIYHYPILTYEQFERKVINGGSSIESNENFDPTWCWHWTYWYKLYKNGSLRDEYQRLILDKKSIDFYLNLGIVQIDYRMREYIENLYKRTEKDNIEQLYDDGFYQMHEPWIPEYRVISDFLKNNLEFESVVDFGCGNGYILWLLQKAGKKVRGVEGSAAALKAANEQIKGNLMLADLRYPLFVGKHELVICTEVAEHLEEEYADTLLDTMVRNAKNTIYFTAATPEQTGGIGHVNLQEHDYWIEKMQSRGYQVNWELTNRFREELASKITNIVWFIKNSLIFEKVSETAVSAKAARENTLNEEQLLTRVEQLIEQQELNEAKSLLEGLLAEKPESVEALTNLAVVEYLGQNQTAAIRLLERVLQLDPENEIAVENLSFIRQSLNEI
ncbi:MAG: hypothetical protein Kow0037_09460 [Calditrichia bacterium]